MNDASRSQKMQPARLRTRTPELPFRPALSVLFIACLASAANAALPAAAAPAASAITASSVPPPATDPVSTGKYLADAAHCSACHTSRSDRPYAGNLPFRTKFGTLYSSNITPDPATGIGRWTEAQFTAALRDGKGSHGEYLYPAMPYVEFTKITDADVHALWAYFRTVAPVVQKPHANQMKFPFDVRLGIGAWQAVYLKKGRYVDDPSQTPQWNRGAYLVGSLGHCSACHTPKNFAMAEKKGHMLQGGEIDNWFAPDISGGRFSGIQNWSQEQVFNYLKTGHNAKNLAAVGPMLQTIAQGTSKLDDGDLQAIAFYLKNQVATAEAPLPKSDSAWNADRRAAGATVYVQHCQSCHGADGQGADGVAPALAGNTAITSKGADTVVHAVLQGFAPQGRWGVMPSFTQTLDAQEISDVVNYVRTAWGARAPANATPTLVNSMRFAGVATEPGVQSALVCPSAPTDQLDADTLREVGGLAARPGSEAAGAKVLLGHYRARHPGISASETITALAGAYCRDVMAHPGGSYVDKQQRFIGFMTRVSTASAVTR